VEEPEGRAALGLGGESPADIAERSDLIREDVRERPCEQAVQRGRVAGKDNRQDVEGGVVRFDPFRHRPSFAGQRIYSPLPIAIGIL